MIKEADSILIHLMRNRSITADKPIVPQLRQFYVPSFFEKRIYPIVTWQGRILSIIHLLSSKQTLELKISQLFKEAINSSQQPMFSPVLVELAKELCLSKPQDPLCSWENPALAALQNHKDARSKKERRLVQAYSLLKPHYARKKIQKLIKELSPHFFIESCRLSDLIPRLTFHPSDLTAHMEAVEIVQTIESQGKKAETLRQIKKLLLSPIHTIPQKTYQSLLFDRHITPEVQQWLKDWIYNHPEAAHRDWKKISSLYRIANSRDERIASTLNQFSSCLGKNEYLRNTATNELYIELLKLKCGESLLFKGATGNRVASVQRLFLLVQQLPSEIIEALPDMVTSQEIYNNPQLFIARKLGDYLENITEEENLTEAQRLFLKALSEDPDRELPESFRQKIRELFPSYLQEIGNILNGIFEAFYKNGVITNLEYLDETAPRAEFLELFSIICQFPGLNQTFISGLVILCASVLGSMPREKLMEMLSWIRNNIHRFQNRQLRDEAFKDLEYYTEYLAGKPIEAIITPAIDKISLALNTLYKNVLPLNAALALTHMTGIEHPFLSAPFWLKLTKEPNTCFTAEIYGSGHHLYFHQGESESIQWPRVIGNIPLERIDQPFFQRLLEHTYRARYDPAFTSAGEDLFGNKGTFESLIPELDLPTSLENDLKNTLWTNDGWHSQDSRSFTRILDCEKEVYIAALTKENPHLVLLHLSMEALVGYCRNHIDAHTYALMIPESEIPQMKNALHEVEKELYRHESLLSPEIKTAYEATLKDIEEAIHKFQPVRDSIPEGIPSSISHIIRMGMDGLNIDSEDILRHKQTLSWLFGGHVYSAIELLLLSANRASGITLNETCETAIDDLNDQLARIKKLSEAAQDMVLQSRTLVGHIETHLREVVSSESLCSKIDKAKLFIELLEDDERVWKSIYERTIQNILQNHALDNVSKRYLLRSLQLVKKGRYRRYEIDMVFSRVDNPLIIKKLYTILSFIQHIGRIKRRMIELYRALEKKANYETARGLLETILHNMPHRTGLETLKLIHNLNKIHLRKADFETLVRVVAKFHSNSPERLHPYFGELLKCIYRFSEIERRYAPKLSILQTNLYKAFYKLLQLILNLVNPAGAFAYFFKILRSISDIIPNPVGDWLRTTFKDILRSFFRTVFFSFLKYLARKELISSFYIQEMFSRKEELNLYAKEILSKDHIELRLPLQLIAPKILFSQLLKQLDMALQCHYKHLDELPKFNLEILNLSKQLINLKKHIESIASTAARTTSSLDQVLHSAKELQAIFQSKTKGNPEFDKFVEMLVQYIASQNSAIRPLLNQFSRFCALDQMSYTAKSMENGGAILQTLYFPRYHLRFKVRGQRAYSLEYPDFFMASNQNDPAVRRFGSYLLLMNEAGEKRVILSIADDSATIAWNGFKYLGSLANPLSHLYPLLRPYLSLNIRKGRNLYYVFNIDHKGRLVSTDIESVAYLMTAHILQGNLAEAIHAGEQLNHLLENTGPISSDAEMILWPLMMLSNNLEGRAFIGPHGHIFYLRQKILARFQEKIDSQIIPANRSGFVHILFVATLLQELHGKVKESKSERTLHPSEDEDKQEFLLYRSLHRHVGVLVSIEFHPVDWFEARVLTPNMAQRYRTLHEKYAGKTPLPVNHFFRDWFYSGTSHFPRSYFGASQSSYENFPLETMSSISMVHSNKIRPSFWQLIHHIFRSHVEAIRNPHLQTARVAPLLRLDSPDSESLTQVIVKKHFYHLYKTAIGDHGKVARKALYRQLKVVQGGWDLQSRTLVHLLSTICGMPLKLDKPLSLIATPLWMLWSKCDTKRYEAFKWGGLHPLGLITSPFYGLINRSIWSKNITSVAESLTEFFGTGTNPPIDLTLSCDKGTLSLPEVSPASQIRIVGCLQDLNRKLSSGFYYPSTCIATKVKIEVIAFLCLPGSKEPHFQQKLTIKSLGRKRPLTRGHEPLIQIPHPLRRNYDEVIDHWLSLSPQTYLPSPAALQQLIVLQEDPKAFFELLHSKVHAYQIVHSYTRPFQKSIAWILKNPVFGLMGGKKVFYPLWAEILIKTTSKALIAFKNYHRKAPAIKEEKTPDASMDFTEWFTEENQRFDPIYQNFYDLVFATDGSLKRGQPFLHLFAALSLFSQELEKRIQQDDLKLLETVNSDLPKNIWHRPIVYGELLLCFFTGNFKGIVKELNMNEMQLFSLQTALLRQVTRQIRLESIRSLLASTNACVNEELIDRTRCLLKTHFKPARHPSSQRKILCYEWLHGTITNKNNLDKVVNEVNDDLRYQSLLREAIIKA